MIVLAFATNAWSNTSTKDYWASFPTNGIAGNTVTGTFANGNSVVFQDSGSANTIFGTTSTSAQGYIVWDTSYNTASNPSTTGYTNAAIWPASINSISSQLVSRENSSGYAIKFTQPVNQPRLAIYSLDITDVNFSGTYKVGGTPITGSDVAAVTNTAGYFNLTTLSSIRSPIAGAGRPSEGCFNDSTRMCMYLQFSGQYSEIDYVSTPAGWSDGVGWQVGYAITLVSSDYVGAALAGTAATPIASVFANNTVAGVVATATNATLAPVGIWPTGITLNPDGSVSTTATVPAGSYPLQYQMCDASDPTHCVTSNITLNIAQISAQLDTGTVPAGAASVAIANVLSNDTTDGQPSTLVNSTLTVVTAASNPGVVLDPTTGKVTVAATVPPGIYTITYQLCDQGSPAACSMTTATVTVTGAANPLADTASVPAGVASTPIANVLVNDTTDGQPSTLTNSTLTVVTPASHPGVVLDSATGMVTTTAAVPAGTYTIVYQLCDKANPPVCATATVTVTVTDKSGGKATNVPTLSEYGLMIMGGLLMVFGIPYMRRRRK